MADRVGAAGPRRAVRGQEEAALGQRMASEVQQSHRPGEPREIALALAAEKQRRTQHDHGDRRVLGRGKGEQRAPVVRLEGVEHRKQGRERAGRDNKQPDADRGRARRSRQPAERGVAQAEEGGIEHHAGENGARGAAAARIGAGIPFVKRQQAELGAEAREQQRAHREAQRPGQQRRRLREVEEVEPARAIGKQKHAEQERHRTHLQEAQHEEHRRAGRGRQPLREQHGRAAEAHQLPGHEKRSALLQAEDAERAEQAHRNPEHPSAPSVRRRRAVDGGKQSRDEPEPEQPERLRGHDEADRGAREGERQHEALRAERNSRQRSRDPRRGAECERCAPERGKARQAKNRRGEPEERRRGEQVIRQAGLPQFDRHARAVARAQEKPAAPR